MQTFVAQFIRGTGERGAMRVLAQSSTNALLEVLRLYGDVSRISVEPTRCAALLRPGAAAAHPPVETDSFPRAIGA